MLLPRLVPGPADWARRPAQTPCSCRDADRRGTPKRLNGNHQAVNMAVASALRAASGSVLCASMPGCRRASRVLHPLHLWIRARMLPQPTGSWIPGPRSRRGSPGVPAASPSVAPVSPYPLLPRPALPRIPPARRQGRRPRPAPPAPTDNIACPTSRAASASRASSRSTRPAAGLRLRAFQAIRFPAR